MRINGTDEAIDAHEYPATSNELIDEHGEREIEHPAGSETFGEVLGRLEADTYADSQSVYEALLSAVGHEAVGRRYYSDRDAVSPGEDGPDQVSF